jgi:hypothetical protein
LLSQVRYYIDGELDPGRSSGDHYFVNTVAGGTAAPVTIGMTYNWSAAHNVVYPQFFSGALADVRIYDHALGEEEIGGIIFPPQHVFVSFVRGNANADESTDLSDAVFILNYLFLGGPEPSCDDAADADDNGLLQITDAVYLLNFLFLGKPQPPSPYPSCGIDPTGDRPDDLSCDVYPPCEPAER